ncbi:MAG: AEC family transporter [Opitutaceae bacterium]
MDVLDSLLPVFLIIGLGAILTARGFLTPEFLKNLNRLAYYIGMPGLLFVSVSGATALGERPVRIALVILGSSLLALVIAYPLARLLRIPAPSTGTFVQSCFRSNLAFVGLPLVLYIFSDRAAPESAAELVPIVAVAIAPVMIAYNVLAVIVLVSSHQRVNGESLHFMTRQVLTNPLVIAIAAGLLATTFSFRLPSAIESTIGTIGGLAIPAALFGVGGTIVQAPLRKHLRSAISATLLKVAAMPLIGFALAQLLQLPPLDAAIASMLCATPTAAASFIMSTQLRGDLAVASSSIALSTLVSAVPLAIAVHLLPPAS